MNPILEEVWRIKDELAREADNDLHRLCEIARQEAAKIPNLGPRIETPEELRRYFEQQEAMSPGLREETEKYGQD